MRPLAIAAKNLRSWRELDVALPAGVTAIVGDNGAGKSTLIHVLDLALFGSGRELKRALSRGAGETTVTVELLFEHRDRTYRVRRGYDVQGRGKPILDLFRTELVDVTGYEASEPETIEGGWEPLTGETIDETQQTLEGIIGLTRQTFRASSYLAQGDGAAFTQAEPRERKAILLDALGVHVWDRLKANVSALRRDTANAVAFNLATVEQAEGQVALREGAAAVLADATLAHSQQTLKVTDLEAGVDQARKKLEDARALDATARHARESVDSAKKVLAGHDAEVKRIDEVIREAGDRLDKRDEFAKWAALVEPLERVVSLRTSIESSGELLRRLDEAAVSWREREAHETALVDEYSGAVARLESELADFDENLPKCPTCGQELESNDSIDRTRRAIKAKVTEAEGRRDKALADAIDFAKRGHAVEVELTSGNAEQNERLREEADLLTELGADVVGKGIEPALTTARQSGELVAALDEIEKTREAAVTRRAELDDVYSKIVAGVKDAEAKLAEVETVTDIRDIEAKLRTSERELTDERRNLDGLATGLGVAKARVDAIDEVAGELEAHRARLADSREVLALYEHAERAYGRDGVPALIIENAVPHLEAEANRIVRDLGRDYRFELRTQRETQTGSTKEVLDIIVATPTGEAAYEDFSGGERTRLDLALRIALARLLAARRAADVKVLAIDEPAFLDDEGLDQLAGVLRGLVSEFETILVVSHVDALRGAFDRTLTVAGGGDTGEPSTLQEV